MMLVKGTIRIWHQEKGILFNGGESRGNHNGVYKGNFYNTLTIFRYIKRKA